MEERSLRVYNTNKTFLSKITSTITKILMPTKIGINGMLIAIKRNNVLKAYEAFIETTKNNETEKKESILKKYEDTYALYLESIDKYIMDSIYKKVKSETATDFERNALSKYYTVIHLKDEQYLEYKYKKQQYLLELDYETILLNEKEKIIDRYNMFYISKMDALYKGLLKHYSVQLADNVKSKDRAKIFDKIFKNLEDYVVSILPLKMKKDSTNTYKNILSQYEKFEEFEVGKLDNKDLIAKKVVLLGISRQLFTHSLPLAVAEQCYEHLLVETRTLLSDTKMVKKRETIYKFLLELIEEYNLKLLSTKIYWDKQEQREKFKSFWKNYQEIEEIKEHNIERYKKEKEILFIKDDLSKLWNTTLDYTILMKFYKEVLKNLGAMRELKNSCISTKNYKNKKALRI